MPARRTTWFLAITGAHLLVLWASFYVPEFGVSPWYHIGSLGLVVAISIALRRPLAGSRRFLAIGVLAFSLLAAVSGFWLLYWKEGIRAAGFQDWGVFWHVAWSWAAAVFFFQHTWINRVALGHFVRQRFTTLVGALTHGGAYVLVLAAFFVTWSNIGKGWFTVESYIPLSLYAWLAITGPAYLIWLWTQLRIRLQGSADPARSTLVRGRIDVALVPFAALAVLSGVPLTFFDPFMDENGWKYVSKYWHVWPSVAFTALVFIHSVQTWRTTRAHWRNVGIALGDVPRPGPAVTAPVGSGVQTRLPKNG